VTVPAANILAIEVFGTNIFTDILCHKRGTDLILCLPLLSSYPTVSSPKFQDMGTGLIWFNKRGQLHNILCLRICRLHSTVFFHFLLWTNAYLLHYGSYK